MDGPGKASAGEHSPDRDLWDIRQTADVSPTPPLKQDRWPLGHGPALSHWDLQMFHACLPSSSSLGEAPHPGTQGSPVFSPTPSPLFFPAEGLPPIS